MKSYLGKTALVTGGSSGIGLALARLLAQEGAHVWILARDPVKLDAACQQIKDARRSPDQQVVPISADVANFESVSGALQPVLQQYGVPDLVINSAGVTFPGEFWNIPMEKFHEMMDVNYFGILHVLKCVVPGMMERRSGEICNISSAVGIYSAYGYSAYGPSKFAVSALSQSIRSELQPYNIQVSTAFPTDVLTPQLEFEKSMQAPVMIALNESANKPVTPEAVAAEILKSHRRGKSFILPTPDARQLYMVYRALPGNSFFLFIDFLMAQAWRSVAKHNNRH